MVNEKSDSKIPGMLKMQELDTLEENVKNVLEEHPHFQLTRGKKVY